MNPSQFIQLSLIARYYDQFAVLNGVQINALTGLLLQNHIILAIAAYPLEILGTRYLQSFKIEISKWICHIPPINSG